LFVVRGRGEGEAIAYTSLEKPKSIEVQYLGGEKKGKGSSKGPPTERKREKEKKRMGDSSLRISRKEKERFSLNPKSPRGGKKRGRKGRWANL